MKTLLQWKSAKRQKKWTLHQMPRNCKCCALAHNNMDKYENIAHGTTSGVGKLLSAQPEKTHAKTRSDVVIDFQMRMWRHTFSCIISFAFVFRWCFFPHGFMVWQFFARPYLKWHWCKAAALMCLDACNISSDYSSFVIRSCGFCFRIWMSPLSLPLCVIFGQCTITHDVRE